MTPTAKGLFYTSTLSVSVKKCQIDVQRTGVWIIKESSSTTMCIVQFILVSVRLVSDGVS